VHRSEHVAVAHLWTNCWQSGVIGMAYRCALLCILAHALYACAVHAHFCERVCIIHVCVPRDSLCDWEFGHFVAVDSFSFGFPQTVAHEVQIGETEKFRLSLSSFNIRFEIHNFVVSNCDLRINCKKEF